MEIILKKSVEKLGEKGEMVTVKPGYGRNFLIPQGYAVLATPSMKKMHAENSKQREHKEKAAIENAKQVLAKLTSIDIKVGAKVGENGKIFGSVTSVQVAEAINKLGYDVERKHLKIKNEPVKTTGKYDLDITLHREVKGTISFEVVED